MKKLVLFSLIVGAASQTVACTSSSGSNAGYITASWNLTNIAKQPLGCPAGFNTAALYSQEIDANYNDVGAPTIDLFNCADFHGVSAPLAPTTYYSWITIATDNNAAQYASSTSAYVDLTSSDKSYTAVILEDGGYFQLQWQLQAGGAPTSCAARPDVSGIETVSTSVSNSNNFASDIFPCADHLGITSGFSAGTYTVSVDALNSNNQAIGTPTTLTNKTIQAPNKLTDLGTVTVQLN
jgi:hypothetical protein